MIEIDCCFRTDACISVDQIVEAYQRGNGLNSRQKNLRVIFNFNYKKNRQKNDNCSLDSLNSLIGGPFPCFYLT